MDIKVNVKMLQEKHDVHTIQKCFPQDVYPLGKDKWTLHHRETQNICYLYHVIIYYYIISNNTRRYHETPHKMG